MFSQQASLVEENICPRREDYLDLECLVQTVEIYIKIQRLLFSGRNLQCRLHLVNLNMVHFDKECYGYWS